ncbi:hypothetical protein CBOM_00858 [Ceraceosorus bombacis]|uniref:Uncharacterized protein n=1 Tax=Ceraceosorus bombacis TaxID=401625 RepID=A0A0P1BAP6_9BASI|nr:hypothetical protein CBOM_00858 [Ceraceosorus bombacis]
MVSKAHLLGPDCEAAYKEDLLYMAGLKEQITLGGFKLFITGLNGNVNFKTLVVNAMLAMEKLRLFLPALLTPSETQARSRRRDCAFPAIMPSNISLSPAAESLLHGQAFVHKSAFFSAAHIFFADHAERKGRVELRLAEVTNRELKERHAAGERCFLRAVPATEPARFKWLAAGPKTAGLAHKLQQQCKLQWASMTSADWSDLEGQHTLRVSVKKPSQIANALAELLPCLTPSPQSHSA